MDINTTLATQSYAKLRDIALPDPQTAPTDNSFLKIAESFAQTLNRSEDTARAAMTGAADPHALVEALAAAETAVETVVTVRDKVVEAYQEILRMPV
jgi:flagellar hook-basal body complex protein FliE